MATSRPLETDPRTNRESVYRDRFSREDLVLLAIPLALLVALVVHLVAGGSPQAAIAVAGVVGVLALVDALVLNPPTSGGRGTA